MREEIRKIQALMESAEYVTDAPVATSVHLALSLKKPLLIEGHAGVGKTEVAKVMARVLATNLIRLQCYEGLDASAALYEWNYQKQLLHIKLHEGAHRAIDQEEQEIFSEPFLLKRPLLQAITQDRAPVLLVDEVDRCVTADTLIATSAGLKRADDIQAGDELVSFDPDAFRVTRASVRKVVPRSAPRVLRILVGGRLLDVTPEHKFVRYSDTGPEVVGAAELRVGDRLPLHKSLHLGRRDEPVFEFADDIVKLATADKRLLHTAYRKSGRTYANVAASVGVSRTHLGNVIRPHPMRASLRAGVLARPVDAVGLDADVSSAKPPAWCARVCQSVAFYELLGYIVADGCFTRDRLSIADKDRTNLEVYGRKFVEVFGRPARIKRGPHRNFELTCHSLPLGRFLERVLGPAFGRSPRRRVPSFVFALPSDKRAGFVRGFFDGEGWVGEHQVSTVSSSPALLVGIQHLLSSVGVDSHLTKIAAGSGTFGKGPYFQLAVSNVHAFANAVGFCAPAKRTLL
ncbi:MAG TPA: LAGLIDADG family homing endonuclease, partial [Methylomirabilota bacterium]|nr:LAGLIDADG family homing endonuclease [Methylomirabilota bacterium]